MIKELIIGNLATWFQRYVGKYFFPKDRIRWKYKDKLIEISDYFNDAMDTGRKSCSLSAVLEDARRGDNAENIKVQCQKEKAIVLEKWYASLRHNLSSANPKNMSKYFEEFAEILRQTQAIFRDFSQIVRDLEKLSEEASKKLKGEFKDYRFNPLTKL
jgi:hypothetical protein